MRALFNYDNWMMFHPADTINFLYDSRKWYRSDICVTLQYVNFWTEMGNVRNETALQSISRNPSGFSRRHFPNPYLESYPMILDYLLTARLYNTYIDIMSSNDNESLRRVCVPIGSE